MTEEATNPKSTKSGASIWMFISLAALVVGLVIDVLLFERNSPLERNFPDDGNAKSFDGAVVLSNLTYDRQTKSAVARLGLGISATQSDLDVQRVTLSYQENSDGSHDWTICRQGDSCLTEYENVTGATGKPLTGAQIQFDSIRLQGIEDPREIFYPFDKATFRLSLLGCVNEGAENCTTNARIFSKP